MNIEKLSSAVNTYNGFKESNNYKVGIPGLTAEQRAELAALVKEVRESQRNMVEGAIACGNALRKMSDILVNAEKSEAFETLCWAEFGIRMQMARRMMNAAERWGGQVSRVKKFPVDIVFQLSSPRIPEDTAERLVTEFEQMPSPRKLRTLLKAALPKPPKKEVSKAPPKRKEPRYDAEAEAARIAATLDDKQLQALINELDALMEKRRKAA